MKQAILTNWTFFRMLRLILGIVILVQGISTKDVSIGFVGLLFTMMPLFNIGCCGAGACNSPTKNVIDSKKEVTYEEVV